MTAVLLGLYSCGKDEPEKEKQIPLLPLNVGNSWTHEQTWHGQDRKETVRMEINSLHVIDGYERFALSEYEKGMPISLLNSDDEGNCVEYLFNRDAFVHKMMVFKNHLQKGDKWIYLSAVYSNYDYSKYKIEEMEMTCCAADTLIVTPKGSFRCVGFSHHPGGCDDTGEPLHTMFQFLSAGAGIVKYVHYEHDNGKTTLFTDRVLTDYSLKQGV
ncbi:MAG: hypothetical protein LBR08_01745 [Bacteroidales bacterium]|nr:hypothetical protein [Bacteroidales bacterium]